MNYAHIAALEAAELAGFDASDEAAYSARLDRAGRIYARLRQYEIVPARGALDLDVALNEARHHLTGRCFALEAVNLTDTEAYREARDGLRWVEACMSGTEGE